MSTEYTYPTIIYPETTPRTFPHGYNVIGTCGKCGGPIITPIMWVSTGTNDPPPEFCMDLEIRNVK